ncbi:hypothetical protein PIB30_060018, partial [Stylosanthes scabra]|nr:hypothetical protein [Stylosanthes scabra]
MEGFGKEERYIRAIKDVYDGATTSVKIQGSAISYWYRIPPMIILKSLPFHISLGSAHKAYPIACAM